MSAIAASIQFTATVFEREDIEPISGAIPLHLKGADIHTYLTITLKLAAPDGYFIILILPTSDDKGGKWYRILDDKKDLRKYSTLGSIEIMFYPPTAVVDVRCAGSERVVKRQIDSKRPSRVLVEDLCGEPVIDDQGRHHGYFGLEGPIAYCLYHNPEEIRTPVPLNRSLVEFNPWAKSLWLQRRFWIQRMNRFTRPPDVVFNYAQAKQMVWREDFDAPNYNGPNLVALAFCVEYETYDRAAALVAECKNKKRELAQYFPPWMCHESKHRKDRKKALELMIGYKGKDKLTLQLWFIRDCLKNKYFGSVDFKVHTVVPNSGVKDQQEVLLTITEFYLILNDPTTHEELFSVRNHSMRKWRPKDTVSIIFQYTDTNRKHDEFTVHNDRALLILDHFTSLMNFLKQARVQSQTDELGDRLTRGFHTTSGSSASTMSVLMRNDQSLLNMSIDHDGEDEWPSILPRVEAPLPQRATFTDPDSYLVPVRAGDYATEFEKCYDHSEQGFQFQEIPMYQVRDNLIEQGCMLIRSAIQTGISPTLIGKFLDVNLPNSEGMQQILTQFLDGPWDPAVEGLNQFRVGLTATCLEEVMTNELPPLDAFVALNYMRSLLLDYGQKQWRDFDFVGQASKIDEKLGTVVNSALGVMHRASHPLATVLFEAMSGTLPEAKAQLMLNTAIADGLMMIAISVGRALCDAGIGELELRPLVASVPEVPVFDPIFASRLAETLLPIIRDVAGDDKMRTRLLAQPHVARVEPNSMVKAVQDLAGLTHFMNSPLAMYIQSKGPNLTQPLATPTTMAEAVATFKTAREMALMLWNMDEVENAAVAYELSERAATMYSLFCHSTADPSLNATLAEEFKALQPVAHAGIETLKLNTDLASLLSPNDPLHNLALGLINGNEDWTTAASLLTLEAMDEKQTKGLVVGQGEQLDALLRGLNGPVGPLELDKFANLFKMWSLGVLSCAPGDQGTEIRAKIAEIGAMLMMVLEDFGLSEEARHEKIDLIRSLLRPLLALGEEGEEAVDVLKQFLSLSDDPSKAKPYEIPFNAQAPDLTVPIAIVKKLRGVLGRFQRPPRAN
jgi:hypothetical protein